NSEDVSLTPLFEWNAADGADSYHLVVSPNSDFSDPVIDESEVSETEFQTVDDLNVSTIYYWRVRGVNAGGPGEWSETFSFTTLPEVPSTIVLSSPADEAINVGLVPEFTWETDDGVDTYQIQVTENDDLSSPVIDESGLENTSFTPGSDLANATVYYWRVRGANAAGNGSWSEVFSFTSLPESSEVVILTGPSDDAEGVSITPLFEWNPADGADTYDLVVSPNSDFSDPVIDESEVSETEFQTVDALIFSTTYNWRARGRNAAGPGEWSESFRFTTLDQPKAADNRILVANNASYSFTPIDFGQSDNSYVVIIEDLPSGFKGSLELDGSGMAADEEISVLDIESGDLTYSPPQGSYGYNFDRFDFSITDDEGNPSEDVYTLTIDLAATSIELVGTEGWRFLASPVNGETAGGFFEPIWTQGFEGSDSPAARFANIQTLNQEEYTWEPVASSESEFNAGDPFIAYIYADDNNGTPPESGFPKTLFSSNENWLNLDGNYQQVLDYDSDQQESSDSFYLWGNPYPVALDLCEAGLENIAENAYFWDSSQNDGNGDYINLSCNAGDEVEIAPYQSVWFRVTDESNRLELPAVTFMEDQTEGFFKRNDTSDLFLITLNVESRDQEKNYSGLARIFFDEDAARGADLLDAPKLSAAGFAERYLSLYSLDDDMNPYDLQALPSEIGQKLRIPLGIVTTEAGEYTMQWTLPGPHLFSGSVYLRDHQTNEVMELKEGESYRFEVDAIPSSDHSKGSKESVRWTGQVEKEPRFELLIAASGVDGLTELGDVPTDFTLAQNYPNPFNPTTQISYQLPVDSRVRLAVFDMLGRQVATLVDEQMSAGRHSVTFDAGNLSSGIYLYRLQAGNTVMTRKLTIMK
ncbi:MAG: T9SS type A sorting domain-containing protein, partial [Bacteroidetes bacterium]|nr:T9SS type A sorting domain-containing protein [Bacteroidota bacterium]